MRRTNYSFWLNKGSLPRVDLSIHPHNFHFDEQRALYLPLSNGTAERSWQEPDTQKNAPVAYTVCSHVGPSIIRERMKPPKICLFIYRSELMKRSRHCLLCSRVPVS